jgi:threonine dehydratase
MEERALTLIPPFDHPHIIAGQGTAAKELFEEVGELDYLFTPCGGGGLLSGSLLSAQALSPGCRVYGVEPEAGDDGVRSFATGTLQTVKNPQTIADGARTPSLGVLTFAIIKELAAGMLTASDDELVRTMRFLWERMKIIIEPTGVLGLAPLFHGRLDIEGKRVGVILSGGNVDLKRACELFANSSESL